MPSRVILTDRQRAALFDLPSDETTILRHYILSETDLALVNDARGPPIGSASASSSARFATPAV